MNEEKIKSLISTFGFTNLKIIDTSILEFNSIFRDYCKENLCGNYNKNYSCPPKCKSAEEMKNKVLSYNTALVLTKNFVIEDLTDKDKIQLCQKQLNDSLIKLKNEFANCSIDCLMIGSSHCNLCKLCKLELKEPCAHPDLQFSCMSAYCINVKNLAEYCDMNYEYKNNSLSLFGMLVFNNKD